MSASPPELAWQGSLFDDGPARVDTSFARLARHTLDAASWVDHAPGWLRGSDAVFAELLTTAAWRQREVQMYDRRLLEPRLTAHWGGPGEPSAPASLALMGAIVSERYGVEIDSIGVNLYRDGRDSVAWHRDRVAKVLTNPLVATVSLGSRRRFLLRPDGGGRTRQTFELGHGDLLVMGGACQHDWEHTVPKVASAGPRMSVTLRHTT